MSLLAILPALALDIADTPAGMAQQLLTVEQAIRDPDLSYDPDAGHTQQLIYRQLVRDSAAAAAVLAALPADVATIAQRNITATAEIMGTVGRKRTTVPAWRIVEAAPAAELLAHYKAAEADMGIPWEILAAINLVETRMGRLRGVSTAGAAGPMQFIPETWARFGQGDILDERDAIFAAARHLSYHGGPDNLDKALWHYNPTDHYVRAVRGYAAVMEADPLAYRGYYAWQVYYTTTAGYLHLAVGYDEPTPVPVAQWCAAVPGRCPGDN